MSARSPSVSVRVRPHCFRRRPPAHRRRVPGNESTLIDARFRSAERVVGHTYVAKRRVEPPGFLLNALTGAGQEAHSEGRQRSISDLDIASLPCSAHRTQHFMRVPQTRPRFHPGVCQDSHWVSQGEGGRAAKNLSDRRRQGHPVRRLRHVWQAGARADRRHESGLCLGEDTCA